MSTIFPQNLVAFMLLKRNVFQFAETPHLSPKEMQFGEILITNFPLNVIELVFSSNWDYLVT